MDTELNKWQMLLNNWREGAFELWCQNLNEDAKWPLVEECRCSELHPRCERLSQSLKQVVGETILVV